MMSNIDPNMVETIDQVYECYEVEHSISTVRWLHPMFQNGTFSKDNSCQPPNPGELLTKEEFYNEMNTNSELYKEWEKSITTLYFYISKQNKKDEEFQQMDEISVISRQKSISNTGLNRDELLERNTKIMGKKSKRIVKILTQQVSEKMADENYLRGLLDSNLISMEEFLKITMSENGK